MSNGFDADHESMRRDGPLHLGHNTLSIFGWKWNITRGTAAGGAMIAALTVLGGAAYAGLL